MPDLPQGRTLDDDGGVVHVRAGIHYGGQTTLIILHRNVNVESYACLLETHMLPGVKGSVQSQRLSSQLTCLLRMLPQASNCGKLPR